MRFAADLHIHSRFSRATSRNLDLSSLHAWAQLKGLTVIGTGDFTHPAWRAELVDQLVPAEPGLYELRADLRREAETAVPHSCRGTVRFVPQVEISTIYKAGDRTRKVHHIILCPTLEAAGQLSVALDAIGNVTSDGRPILGLDSRDLLEMVLEHCPGGHLIPAHIWTPWFSVLGSKSGFDSIEACYRDLTDHIFAVETGLSSDPPMNWRVGELDRFALVSNSDAHSAAKLGRECNLFDADLSYAGMMDALREQDSRRFLGTVEFFPEEGKYHLDGHRKCSVRLSPEETRAANLLCPECGKPVTVGVMHRVEDLADRPTGEQPANATPFQSLIGLAETVGHVMGRGPNTKGVTLRCEELFSAFGPELQVLQTVPIADIERQAGDLIAEAVKRVRRGEVTWKAGFDGEFGKFEILSAAEREELTKQISFFGSPAEPRPNKITQPAKAKASRAKKTNPPARTQRSKVSTSPADSAAGDMKSSPARPPSLAQASQGQAVQSAVESPLLEGLGVEQREAVVASSEAPILVIAGPGTGKTRTLTTRIAYEISTEALDPTATLALTFTNRAAEEMAERLQALLGDAGGELTVMTFHAWGLALLRAAGLARPRVLDEDEHLQLVAAALEKVGVARHRSRARRTAQAISLAKAVGREPTELPDGLEPETFAATRAAYEELLEQGDAFDFDDLVLRAAIAIEGSSETLSRPPRAVFVDEYQDLNPTQVRLLRAVVVGHGARLFAIGDPDQAIYGFRGADPQRILEFHEDWPGARTLTLGRSYRSSDTILEAAAQVIAAAPSTDRPRLWSGIAGEPHLLTLTSGSDRGEAERIALLIERLLGGTSSLSFDSGLLESHERAICASLADIAVLYRLRSQGERIAKALGKLGLPVQLARDVAPDPESIATNVMAALRLLTGRAGSAELRETETAQPWAADLAAAAPEILELPDATEALVRVARIVTGGRATRKSELATVLRAARRVDSHRAGCRERRSRATFVTPGRPLDDLLDWIALHTEGDLSDPRVDRIALLTLHGAKGLEWPLVILAGCDDGLLPYRRPGKPTDLDEERRLFFVGMTRAERLLVLSHAEERMIYGRTVQCDPSPFMLEIEERYKKRESSSGGERRKAPRAEQLDLF